MKTLKHLLFISVLSIGTLACAQGFDDVTIKATKLSDHVYMLTGAGGNIGVSVGDDGVFVIDDQFAPLTKKIEAAIKTLSDKQIKFLVNTHYHGDHTGGNENMHNLGATIIAHDNVRQRLETTPKRDNTMNTKEALPIITFNDELSLHINGEKVAVFHTEHAHTDGDALLYFTKSNVLHTGDTFFQGHYPYIDLKSGGSVNGYINAVKKGLSVINDDTKIIPGHFAISNKVEYQNYLKMLEDLKAIIIAEIEKGKTEDQVANDASLTKTYDDLGYSWNFITSEKIRRTFYRSLK
ncbi:MBL fold metallo-hydrolase [Ichthyenterobacterium magnum]|uniref:Glyoxylase-like metal-dependent hydrolase (Beta-lactamase superfamily II) n=1 Tax=Ichthyenterobacterium magnum TaxID=1230530 RepID=A0A420DXZ7_9FLAO|nr:MBL fold metallo-hydrolase [Ichthyenterobacterium magnum]RKE99095.1 glyoxylase-like metal-dependent hydrolase (beta-lactamase superfamily II) [Ichthyenterobacterium magnum]